VGGLAGLHDDPLITGVGIVLDARGQRVLEVRVGSETDAERLARWVSRSYGLPVQAVAVRTAAAARALLGLRAGEAIGHVACGCFGTVGCFLVRSGQAFLLTNSHVAALEGHAHVGDLVVDVNGDAVAQLERFTSFHPRSRHRVDAAVAELLPGASIGSGRPFRRRRAQLGEFVVKSGAASGISAGRVVSTSYSLLVHMDRGEYLFVDQIAIEPVDSYSFSEPGDSGSFIHADAAPYDGTGLLFAGDAEVEDTVPWTYANHVEDVWSMLRLT